MLYMSSNLNPHKLKMLKVQIQRDNVELAVYITSNKLTKGFVNLYTNGWVRYSI